MAIKATSLLLSDEGQQFMENSVQAMVDCYKRGGKILIAGNGGSLCDAMHFAEEMTAYYRKERPALPAIALADPGHITAVGNDTHFDKIFERGVEAFGKKGDVFVALTTSGNSANIVLGAKKAKEMGLVTVGFLGKTGGKLAGKTDIEWIVRGFETSDRVQEAHMAAIHIIIECIEYELFYKEGAVEREREFAKEKIGV